ncbi:fibronectin type III domain-containing protein [Bacillus subtilis]|nr:fibronectin type III domain-containing protein [Bacillus subtilis]MBL3648776.1 fibronectin type III domain-containing protein [Bacillus sp. RHFS10]MCY9082404.1 fibronectin type III domain-containing protein [Bacillus inaquosorum]POX34471.1 alpha-mannosidase [Bacillus sp. Ru63]MBO3767027.1 fibronectin type III domain-containing protein [Bacillus subtilis]MBT2169074.1 fibronectin type III domain-containing protein [Bacillus subtilis]
MTVEWNPVAGATSYNIYRGSNKTFDKSVTQPIYTTTGMSPDTQLTINVTAVNNSGESAMSEIVTRTQA